MIARLRKGAVINLFLLAGIGLLIYYATTLTERGQTERSPSSSGADGARSFPRSVNVATLTERGRTQGLRRPSRATRLAPIPRSVNVAYHRHSYPVDFRHRWLLEKAHRLRTNTKLKAEHVYAQRLLRQLERARHVQAVHETDWRARQIAAAEVLGREGDAAGTDPWPNCPDPYDHGGASWDDTVACENSGSWLDSPGWYRCGLQFDPMWETRFGRLCR